MKMACDHGKTVAADGFFNENAGNFPLNKISDASGISLKER